MTGDARRLAPAVLGVALAAAVLGLAVPLPAAAASSDAYVASVDQALQILRDAPGDDANAAHHAADVLEAGTGQSQREILADLRQDPPNVADARTRLAALSEADHQPIFAPEPGRASTAIDDILNQPRYAQLHQAPSLGDRIREALVNLLQWVLERAVSVVTGTFGVVFVAAAVAALLLLVVMVVRANRWTGRGGARVAAGSPAEAVARDRFAEADRLATAGDLGRAVRSLAGAVAAALGDDRDWESSPLTVRELFSRSPDPPALRPLLVAFEAAAYGSMPPDEAAYNRASVAAAPFRASRAARAVRGPSPPAGPLAGAA